jgi:hypothetical protein
VKVTFRDITGIQKKAKDAYVHPIRKGDDWERADAWVFGIPMKVTDEPMSAQTDDILTCEPLYDDAAIGTTSTGFKKLATLTAGIPVAIQVCFNGQRLALQIANNAPQIAVLNQVRARFGQEVEFAPHQPLPWVPNKVYLLRPVSATSDPIITQGTRNELAGDKIPVNIMLLLGDNQYREVDVMIPTVATGRGIVNAWWRTIEERRHAEPNFDWLSQESGDYAICDGKGKIAIQLLQGWTSASHRSANQSDDFNGESVDHGEGARPERLRTKCGNSRGHWSVYDEPRRAGSLASCVQATGRPQ